LKFHFDRGVLRLILCNHDSIDEIIGYIGGSCQDNWFADELFIFLT